MLNAAGLSIPDAVIACQLLLRLRFRIVGRVDRGEEGRTNERKDACRSVRSLAVVNADKRWAGILKPQEDFSVPSLACRAERTKRTDLARSSLELLSNLPPLDAFVPSRLDEFDEDLLGVSEGHAWRLEVCEEGREGDG